MINEIKKNIWVERWAGSYTFISCSYWGKQYKASLEKYLGIGFEHTLFFHKKGVVSFYLPKSELDGFGTTLSKRVEKNNVEAINWCNKLKENTDKINKAMESINGKLPSVEEYKFFQQAFFDHLAYHNAIKKTIDYLPLPVLEKLLPAFTEARKYSETIYSDTESFFRHIMKKVAEKENYNSDYLTCLTEDEFEDYLFNNKLPNEDILKERFDFSVLYFGEGEENIFTGKSAGEFEESILKVNLEDKNLVTGISAFGGKITGVARIILDPHKVGIFNEGDILVTGMTRPEFIPVIKKAGAIITNAGGILCHAAITAREMKKTCVVGTGIASQVFKDGDFIEVDGDKGIIKKINN